MISNQNFAVESKMSSVWSDFQQLTPAKARTLFSDVAQVHCVPAGISCKGQAQVASFLQKYFDSLELKVAEQVNISSTHLLIYVNLLISTHLLIYSSTHLLICSSAHLLIHSYPHLFQSNPILSVTFRI